jgi:hypothetical protein
MKGRAMSSENSKPIKVINKGGGPVGFVFFAAWIGALVYFVQKADGFWEIILAILQSIVWPAYLLYHVFKLLAV